MRGRRRPLAATARWWRDTRPRRGDLRAGAVAGLPGAVASVPDGMASSVLAGVGPAYGLYASFAGTAAGGLAASTRLMVVSTTTAAALATGSVLAGVDERDRVASMVLVTLLAGVAMVLAGIAGLGRYTRFVSHSVMTGFLTGVAVNILAGQLGDLAGADAEGPYALARAMDVVTNPTSVHVPSLLVGLGAIALLVGLGRTSLGPVGSLVALAVPTLGAALAGADVARVDDGGTVPAGLPLPAWPELRLLSLELVAGALSVAAIVLVQGAGVAESAPDPGGRRSDANRDFVAQGVGNLASGLFRGVPVGGSVGQTAVNVAAGARTRWASVASGLWMLVILVAFAPVVGAVATPTLAAVLVVAAVGSLRPAEVATIMRAGPTSTTAVVTTFLATLFLPVTAAVGIGVALSLLLQLNQEAVDLKVVELVRRGDGWAERPPPGRLRPHATVVLDIYGSLFYAGARTLEARLPRPDGVEQPAVVLRLRGRTSLGATFILVVAGYAEAVAAAGGRLYLSGLDPDLLARVQRSGRVAVDGPVRLYEAGDLVGASTATAYDAAEAWLVRHPPPPPPPTETPPDPPL